MASNLRVFRGVVVVKVVVGVVVHEPSPRTVVVVVLPRRDPVSNRGRFVVAASIMSSAAVVADAAVASVVG